MIGATYEYLHIGPDQYLVIKRHNERRTDYIVSLRNGDMLCSCPGFLRWKKKCHHVKFILNQLADKGGIIREATIEDVY